MRNDLDRHNGFFLFSLKWPAARGERIPVLKYDTALMEMNWTKCSYTICLCIYIYMRQKFPYLSSYLEVILIGSAMIFLENIDSEITVPQLVKLGITADVSYVIFTRQIHPLGWTEASGGPVMALWSYVCHP